MRLLWTFFAGLEFAGLAMIVSAPLLGGVALTVWLWRGPLWTTLSGQSYFAVREADGLMTGRGNNIVFRPLQMTLAGEARPQRLLARLEVTTSEFADSNTEGRVRLDAWKLEAAGDLRHAPLYTVLAPGHGGVIDPEGTLTIEHLGGRHSVYSLADGGWLFDSDTPLATFTVEGERKRVVALAQADDDMPAGAVAVVTYASPQRAIRRLLISADNPVRGRFLRGGVAMARPVARLVDAAHRILEISLPAGMIRVGFAGDDLDLTPASIQLPDGLSLAEMRPWTQPSPPPPITSAASVSPAAPQPAAADPARRRR